MVFQGLNDQAAPVVQSQLLILIIVSFFLIRQELKTPPMVGERLLDCRTESFPLVPSR